MNNLDGFLSSLSEEQKKQLLKLLASEENQIKNETGTKHPQKSVTVDENFRVTKAESSPSRRREPVRARKNQWHDEGEDRHIETPNYEPTPRKREPQKKIEVECSVCGRPFKTDPKYIYGEYHRCSRCTGK